MDAHPDRGSAGDADAFAALYERYRARLVAYCRRRLYNPADAEDAAHEAMLRAYRAFPGFEPRADAWPWLVTIATRVCTDVRRRQARTGVEPPGRLDHDVHEEAVGRLRAELVGDAIERLPPRYRTTLVLHEFGGWTYDEIAQVQGRTMSSVRSAVARGRRRLGVDVEALARGRGQWPLPGAVPELARRIRLHRRAARHAVVRPVHAALAFADPTALLAVFALGVQASVAAAAAGVVHVGAGTGVAGPPLAATAAGATATASARVAHVEGSVASPLGLRLGDGDRTPPLNPWDLPRETVARVDSPRPPLPSAAPATPAVEVVVQARKESVWVRVAATVATEPDRDRRVAGAETNIPCGWSAGRAVCWVVHTIADGR